MDLPKVKEYLAVQGQPDYRFRQIVQNYFSGRYLHFLDMTDLPLSFRQQLDQQFSLLSVKQVKIFTGENSQKAVLKLNDGLKIESVLMDYGDWQTICVSSQVGCPLGCAFCATGKMGLKRNLTAEEILDQILFWKNFLYTQTILPSLSREDVSDKVGTGGLRLVFMGMGEPFLNWDNLLFSLDSIRNNLKIGARKISISTAGLAPKIKEFADLDTEINLAISLHSVIQSTREKIMPISIKYPLEQLTSALMYYTQKTHRQVFFEYALIKSINDSDHDISSLVKFIKSNKLFYLNIIPLNPVKGGLTPSNRLKEIEKILTQNHVNFSIRHSLGQNIDSACGQLITKN